MAENKVSIRPMEPEDISGILEIDRKIRGQSRAATFDNFFGPTMGGRIDASYVAEQDDQVIGFVLSNFAYVREDVTEACVIQIFGVDPAYQKKGIAKRLFQKLLEECRSKGIESVHVMIEERDVPLQNFFKRIGFDRGIYVDYSITP
ncbi:MAG: GNAT family N-acetyltransferase [Syntrophobacteraceae bacterium]